MIHQINKVAHCSQKKNIAIHYQERPVEMTGHLEAIEVSVRNILDNAIKYSPNHSSIHASIEESKESVHIHIKDNGSGIPDEHKHKIFERFYRILGSQEEGTGLGLNIVKQVIEFHHGSIKVLDNLPQGTHIHITLPKKSL